MSELRKIQLSIAIVFAGIIVSGLVPAVILILMQLNLI